MTRPDEIDELITVINRIDFWSEKVAPTIKWDAEKDKRMRQMVINRMRVIADHMDVELRRTSEETEML